MSLQLHRLQHRGRVRGAVLRVGRRRLRPRLCNRIHPGCVRGHRKLPVERCVSGPAARADAAARANAPAHCGANAAAHTGTNAGADTATNSSADAGAHA